MQDNNSLTRATLVVDPDMGYLGTGFHSCSSIQSNLVRNNFMSFPVVLQRECQVIFIIIGKAKEIRGLRYSSMEE
ncbi:MAG: hypothetical protein ACOYVD_01095 [Bacillota bacterium]